MGQPHQSKATMKSMIVLLVVLAIAQIYAAPQFFFSPVVTELDSELETPASLELLAPESGSPTPTTEDTPAAAALVSVPPIPSSDTTPAETDSVTLSENRPSFKRV